MFPRSRCEATWTYILASNKTGEPPVDAASVQWWPKAMLTDVLQRLFGKFGSFEVDLPMITTIDRSPRWEPTHDKVVTAHLPPTLRGMYSVDVVRQLSIHCLLLEL